MFWSFSLVPRFPKAMHLYTGQHPYLWPLKFLAFSFPHASSSRSERPTAADVHRQGGQKQVTAVSTRNSLFLYYYLLIIGLFSTQTTVNLLLPGPVFSSLMLRVFAQLQISHLGLLCSSRQHKVGTPRARPGQTHADARLKFNTATGEGLQTLVPQEQFSAP